MLDISGAENITDDGIKAVAERYRNVSAADVTGCTGITSAGLRALCAAAPRMHTLRCGGGARCDAAMRAALHDILPRLNPRPAATPTTNDDDTDLGAGALESWEELASTEAAVGGGARALRWLVWPTIDRKSRVRLSAQCPRVRLIAPPPEDSSQCNWTPERSGSDSATDN